MNIPVDRLVMHKMQNGSIWDYTPKWWSKLKNVCPEAISFINDSQESIDQYRGYIKKQNRQINELIEKNNNLEVELMFAQGDDRCRKIAFDAYVSEVLNADENKSAKPF
jgi:hypothetical protein